MACGPSPDAIVEHLLTVAAADAVLVMKATLDSASVNIAPAAESMQPADMPVAADIPSVRCVETSSPQTLPKPPSTAGVPKPQNSCGKKVRFDDPLTTAVWIADSNYDRGSIVVDLSKTPFALFRKDALLMAKPTAVSSTSSNCLSSFATIAASGPVETMSPRSNGQQKLVSSTLSPSLDGPHATTRTEIDALTAAAPAETRAAELSAEASSGATAATDSGEVQTRSDFFGSWDYEESDSSVITDAELSDFEESSPESANGEVEGHSAKPAFFGVWKRDRSEGYEALLLNSGVSKHAAAAALRKHPVHIIDHDGTYFRLIIKNGLTAVDNTYFIGDEPRVVRGQAI